MHDYRRREFGSDARAERSGPDFRALTSGFAKFFLRSLKTSNYFPHKIAQRDKNLHILFSHFMQLKSEKCGMHWALMLRNKIKCKHHSCHYFRKVMIWIWFFREKIRTGPFRRMWVAVVFLRGVMVCPTSINPLRSGQTYNVGPKSPETEQVKVLSAAVML